MKKFFTLCLAFMLASLLNVNAADTYTLVGDLNSWNTSAEGYNFTYVEATDSYVLEDVTLKGEFKIVKNNSWSNPAFGANGNDVPLDAAYIMWNTDSGNMKMIDGKEAVYNDCKLELKVLGAKNASLRITSSTSMQAAIDTRADVWCVAGTFSDNQWNDAYEMTDLGNGVYELWSTELPSEFKFKAKGNWDISLGMHSEIKNTPIMGFDNAVDNGGANISLKADKAYDLYRYTLTVRGWVASFRVDGYKQATPKNTKVTIDLTAQSYVNAEDISSVSDSSKAITVQFNKGTNKSNGPKWYDSGKAVRLYGGNYMTISAPEGQTITSIQFAYGSSDGSNEIIADSGSFTSPTWTGAANSVKFTIAGTSGHRRFAQIYVTYGEANPEWAPKFNDVANGGVYYNSVQYNITAPGAEKMDIVMNKNGANYWSTSTTYIPWYNGADVGEWEIIATAFKGNEFTKTTINFTVEEASAVYSLNEFIGTTGKKYYKFNNLYVLAQGGQYLYVKDDTRCILIYGNSPKFNVGDCFQELVAEYKDYNGQHELIAYQFGQVWGNYPQQPEVVTINDVTVANQSKYVKIENVALNAEAKTIGGVTFSNRFNTELPVDGNYTVTAIIGMSQGTPRLEPLTFEEYTIEPFTYTEIVPANNAEVTSLSEIKITFPYDVTYDASVTMGVLVMDGGNMITPTVAVEGNVATLTFDAITAYGSKPSLMVMEGAFKEATSGVGCQQIMAAWSIPTPPIVPTYVPTGFNPADGSEVEKIGTILIYTDDAYPELSYNAYDDASKCVTVYDAQGNVVEGLNQLLDYASVSGGYAVKYMPNKTAGITEPGTYTFKFAEGTFGDETYYDKNHKKGRVNPEFTITYTIKAAALAAPTVSPANGAEIESPSTITLTFAEAVTVNAEAGELTMVNTGDPNYDKAKNFNVTISEDGLTATITSEPGYLDRWATNATYKLNIPAGYFVGASGAASEALEY
ncbi:MAG: hypothetical protein IIV64_09350, partial [Muribaculaceae bacterium]|nr:hypothetical protein [Muribaculaceae bacterium]